MNTERLLILARALERRQRQTGKPLNMNMWGLTDKDPTPCNTAACAMGVAVRIPELQKQGLGKKTVDVYAITYRKFEDYRAAQEFFNLSPAETHRLFNPLSYTNYLEVKPRTVADRIRRLIKSHQIRA